MWLLKHYWKTCVLECWNNDEPEFMFWVAFLPLIFLIGLFSMPFELMGVGILAIRNYRDRHLSPYKKAKKRGLIK